MQSKSVRVGPTAWQSLDLARLLSLGLNVVGDLLHLHSISPISLAFQDQNVQKLHVGGCDFARDRLGHVNRLFVHFLVLGEAELLANSQHSARTV